MSKRAFCYLPANAPADGFHYLDHIIPLAIELDLPVVIRSEKQRALIAQFYPYAKTDLIGADQPLSYLQEEAVIISNAFRHQLEADLLYERMIYGSYESVYCPHGLSDKELLFGKFQELDDDSKVLLYGEKMQREIPSHCIPFILGNYRKHHFERFKEEYLSILKSYVHKLTQTKWTLLWTPSWVFKFIPGMTLPILEELLEKSLLSTIPENIQVIFKPHPYLLDQIPSTLAKIKEAAESSPNLLYLEEMPYIYPLFENVDAYLGDTSSIGYDFLSTGKPIFSLTKSLESPWQELALQAPVKDGALNWAQLQDFSTKWNIATSKPLLTQSFSDQGPLHHYKEAFYEYLKL